MKEVRATHSFRRDQRVFPARIGSDEPTLIALPANWSDFDSPLNPYGRPCVVGIVLRPDEMTPSDRDRWRQDGIPVIGSTLKHGGGYRYRLVDVVDWYSRDPVPATGNDLNHGMVLCRVRNGTYRPPFAAETAMTFGRHHNKGPQCRDHFVMWYGTSGYTYGGVENGQRIDLIPLAPGYLTLFVNLKFYAPSALGSTWDVKAELGISPGLLDGSQSYYKLMKYEASNYVACSGGSLGTTLVQASLRLSRILHVDVSFPANLAITNLSETTVMYADYRVRVHSR